MDKELRCIIEEDKEYYFDTGCKRVYRFMTFNPLYRRGVYVITARKVGYYSLNHQSLWSKLKLLYYSRRKNKLGEKLGIEIGPNTFGRRIRIYHNNIVINYGAIIGDDCELYGDNCIGNKGSASNPIEAPVVGNRVSFGVGTKAIGKIVIADDVKISSMSFVNKDLDIGNSLYGGVPAKLIRINNSR